MDEEVRKRAFDLIVRMVPRDFWADLEERARWVYSESFEDAAQDPRVRPSQSRFRVISNRFYFMEKVLSEVAEGFGAAAEPEEVEVNHWRYTLTRFGALTFTQKYVYGPAEMASPAHFRKHLAKVNAFTQNGDLFTPARGEVLLDQLNGIITHGPLSREWHREEFKQIGFLRFAIPEPDYSGWLCNQSMSEMTALYEAKEERRTDPKPEWKKGRKPGEAS